MKKFLFPFTALAVVLATAGCVTDSAAPQAKPAATAAPARSNSNADQLIPVAKVNAIAKGMKAEVVRQLLGEPNETKPFTAAGQTGEIWTYRISMVDRTEQTPTSMRDVPAWDPITNKPITLKEPVYQIQHIRTYQTLELLIMDGRLIERKGGVEQDRAFF